MSTIGITGATGQLGRLVVKHLKQKDTSDHIIALVRNVEKAKDLQVEAREFDYEADSDTLQKSLDGIQTLLLISGNEIGKRLEQHQNVIDAAKASGVETIVYTSLLHADKSSLILAEEHLSTEKLLKDSGINYIILRNGWYTENYAGSISGALEKGAFLGSAGDGKISSATRENYAEAAAEVLANPSDVNITYELSGDDYYTLTDFATAISEASGKEIAYKDLSESEYADALAEAGLPKEGAQAYASFDSGARKGDLYDDGNSLSKLIGHATTPYTEVVKNSLVEN